MGNNDDFEFFTSDGNDVVSNIPADADSSKKEVIKDKLPENGKEELKEDIVENVTPNLSRQAQRLKSNSDNFRRQLREELEAENPKVYSNKINIDIDLNNNKSDNYADTYRQRDNYTQNRNITQPLSKELPKSDSKDSIAIDSITDSKKSANKNFAKIASILFGAVVLVVLCILFIPRKNSNQKTIAPIATLPANSIAQNGVITSEPQATMGSVLITTSPEVITPTADATVIPESTDVGLVTAMPSSNTTKIESGSEAVTMIFGGDVLLSDSMVNTYNKSGGKATNVMRQDLLTEFQNADIAMVNQEFPFSTRGEKMQDKQFTFRTDPKYVKIFNELGLDIVSLANNHILDFGIDPLIDSINTLTSAGIKYVGAGSNLSDARQTKYFEVSNKKIAYLSASRVIPVSSWNATGNRAGVFTTYDSTALVSEIKKAKQQADYAVVYVHWGIEHKERPEEFQKVLAKKYIDAGADLVIGCHTHCLQGMEYYKDKPIIYSMGNFMFGSAVDRTLALKVILDKNGNNQTSIIPCSSSGYCTGKITDNSKLDSFYKYYTSISYGLSFDENGIVTR